VDFAVRVGPPQPAHHEPFRPVQKQGVDGAVVSGHNIEPDL
jgi:hypothetical protein